MADPGAQAVVTVGVHRQGARADTLDPSDVLSQARAANVLSGLRREQPHGAGEEAGFSLLDAAVLLSRHRMSGKKAAASAAAEDVAGAREDVGLGAADVGDEGFQR